MVQHCRDGGCFRVLGSGTEVRRHALPYPTVQLVSVSQPQDRIYREGFAHRARGRGTDGRTRAVATAATSRSQGLLPECRVHEQ